MRKSQVCVLENADLLRLVCQRLELRDLGGLRLASKRISEIVRSLASGILQQCDDNRKKACMQGATL